MVHHRYYVGTVTRNGRPVPLSSLESCADLLISVYGGYSLFTARGAWRDDKGEIKQEPSRVYECLLGAGKNLEAAARIAEKLAALADQATVLWTVDEVQGGFS